MLTTESDLIDRALAEDVGDGDATTEATVDAGARGRATITQKAPGVISGLEVAEAVFLRLDPDATIERLRAGGRVARGRPGAAGRGLRAGAADRRADGAELPRPALRRRDQDRARRARRSATGGAKILDTRKTTPGLRMLEKARGRRRRRRQPPDRAVRLHPDQGEPLRARGRRGRGGAARRGPRGRSCRLAVEVRDAAEIDEALEAGAPRLLLDNMTPDAGARRGRPGGRPRGARRSAAASMRRQFWSMRPLRV